MVDSGAGATLGQESKPGLTTASNLLVRDAGGATHPPSAMGKIEIEVLDKNGNDVGISLNAHNVPTMHQNLMSVYDIVNGTDGDATVMFDKHGDRMSLGGRTVPFQVIRRTYHVQAAVRRVLTGIGSKSKNSCKALEAPIDSIRSVRRSAPPKQTPVQQTPVSGSMNMINTNDTLPPSATGTAGHRPQRNRQYAEAERHGLDGSGVAPTGMVPEKLVGKRVEVMYEIDGRHEWFAGTIKRTSNPTTKYNKITSGCGWAFIEFDEGENDWLKIDRLTRCVQRYSLRMLEA